jgi:DNA-binding transcriptional regulator/RsmH inhibitor MraZ
MSSGAAYTSFRYLGPVSSPLDKKGRVSIPADYVKLLRGFPKPETPDYSFLEQSFKYDPDAPGDNPRPLLVHLTITEREDELTLLPTILYDAACERYRSRVDANPNDIELSDLAEAFESNSHTLKVDDQNRIGLPKSFISMFKLREKDVLRFSGTSRGIIIRIEREGDEPAGDQVVKNFRETRRKRADRGFGNGASGGGAGA